MRQRQTPKKEDILTRRKIAAIPYIHGITEKIKKVTGRQNIRVSSAPNKEYSMCERVNQPENQTRMCNTFHRTRYARNQTGVVYYIRLLWGKCYIGQTGRCINDTISERAAYVKVRAERHLPGHFKTFKCGAAFSNFTILMTNNNHFAREMLEALSIDTKQKRVFAVCHLHITRMMNFSG